MTSILRRFASAKISSITGSAPWAPVPMRSRLPPHGISSPAESGVWPNLSRNSFEVLFCVFALCRRRSPHRVCSAFPRPGSRQISPVVLSYLNVLLASRSFKARDTDSKNRLMRKSLIRVQKRSQYFINAHDEPLSVAAMRVSDKTVCPVLRGLLAVQKGSEYSLFECPIYLASSISPENAFGRNSLDAPRGISVNPS